MVNPPDEKRNHSKSEPEKLAKLFSHCFQDWAISLQKVYIRPSFIQSKDYPTSEGGTSSPGSTRQQSKKLLSLCPVLPLHLSAINFFQILDISFAYSDIEII